MSLKTTPVPHSSGNGSTERDQHLGPRAVRHVSAHNRRAHAAYELVPWDTCRINDLGDVPLPEAMDNEACIERITAFFRRLADARTPVVAIGGDHSVTGGILQGLAGPAAESFVEKSLKDVSGKLQKSRASFSGLAQESTPFPSAIRKKRGWPGQARP